MKTTMGLILGLLFTTGLAQAAYQSHPYEWLMTAEVGAQSAKSINFTNWNNYRFNYDKTARATTRFEMGWALKLTNVRRFGLYLSEGVGYSAFSYRVPAEAFPGSSGNESVNLHLFGLDSRLMMAWEGFTVSTLVPFFEAGYLLSFYTQNGTSSLLTADGNAGNPVAALGLRWWMNRGSSLNPEYPTRYLSLPMFLTAKVNHVVSNNSGVDMGGTSVLAGISLGL